MESMQQRSNSSKGLAIATLIAIFGTLIVNTLSNFFPPGGENVGEIANTVLAGVLITPANYAFAIWGVIYLGLIAYGIFQFDADRRQDPIIKKVDKLLIVACIAQIIWIFLFTLQQFALSILAMLGILLPLIGIYLTLHIGQERRVSRQRRWMAHIPFSIYLGWISVATIVNIASALYINGWNGWGLSDIVWTAIMIVVAAIVAAAIILRRSDIAFPLVFVWALAAIAIRHSDIPTIWLTAVIASIVLIGLLAFIKLRGRPALAN
jgi:MFS family permease